MHIKLVILLKFDYQISEFGPRQQDHVATQIYQTPLKKSWLWVCVKILQYWLPIVCC